MINSPTDVRVTKFDTLAQWARTGSMMWIQFGLACCGVEMMQFAMPRYDAERFGFAPQESLRQTDVVIEAGTLTNKMVPPPARFTIRCVNPDM